MLECRLSVGKMGQSRSLPLRSLTAINIILICGLLIFLSGCKTGKVGISNPFSVPSKSGGTQIALPTPSPSPTLNVTPLNTPALQNITLSVVNCPSTLSINWDGSVGTKAHINKVQTVTCGSLEGYGSLDALVNVRYYTPDAKLDVYVYNNLYGTPFQRFNIPGLLDGDAQISPTGTLTTAEIGPFDAFKGAPDVFKEYQWNGSTFAQIYFPGMYPDMTHYQAEQSQAIVTAELAQGRQTDTWRDAYFAVAQNLAVQIFHWTNLSVSKVDYRPGAGIYIAEVSNLGPGGGGFIATFMRLDGVSTNIYEVTKIASLDGYTAITNPAPAAQLSSPINLSGTAQANGSILGRVVVYSDTFVTVGDTGAIQSPVSSGVVSFTALVNYKLNASSGMQEGAVAFFSTNQNNTSLTNQVTMVKILLAT